MGSDRPTRHRGRRGGALVTIGVKPSYAETGYGYIKTGPEVVGLGEGDLRVRSVAAFVEKPDQETAEQYVASGDYLWNSGMLVTRAATVLSQLRTVGSRAATADSAHGEQIADAAEKIAAMGPDEWTSAAARDIFSALPAVPFDKAVLEVSERVLVVPSELDWSDVGSLLSLERLAEPDERGNVLVGNVADIDSDDVLAYSSDRLIATLGLRDVIVVDTADATLVADRSRTQDVRAVVEKLREMGAPEITTSRTSLRPWGSWTLLLKAPGFLVKTIEVQPGKRLSLQSHEHRSEHWVVVEGKARIRLGNDTLERNPGESAYISPHVLHRLENVGDIPLRIIEVAVGDYLEEDDIVRYEDDWER